MRLPAGYELTGISGSSLIDSEPREDGVVLTLGDPALRSHQLLVSLERPHDGGSFSLDTGLVTVRDIQREVGEVAVEGVGTMELEASERDGMHRIDVRELNSALQSLARLPVLFDATQRMRFLHQLGRRSGRLVGSVRERTWYP